MIDEKKKDLARRAVACPGWRWMPGMLLVSAAKDMRPMRLVEGGRAFLDLIPSEAWLPDLDDPATLGCLLALVREVSGARAHVVPARSWHAWVVASPVSRDFWGNTEAEALVAALEAAGR